MKISLLAKLFNKTSPSKSETSSVIVSKIKKFAEEMEYPLFENTPIFYRSKSIETSLILFIPRVGLLLFEQKGWSYKDLNGSTVSKVSHAKRSDDTLSFETLEDFIKEKFIDLTNFDNIDIFNFVIFEHLSESEFDMLDESFHHLLPKERIFFQNTTLKDIEEKFKALKQKQKNYTIQNTLPFIFTQYMIIDKEQVFFANKEQRTFIDRELDDITYLIGTRQSGKSTLLLQKAIREKLQDKNKRITIITPTKVQQELLKQTLFDLVERSMVILDLEDITIVTPDEISVNEFTSHDLLFIDDAFLIEKELLSKLKQSKKENLLISDLPKESDKASLKESYSGEVEFIKASEYPALLKMIYKLTQEEKSADILIFASNKALEDIKEDIEGFSAKKLSLIDPKLPLSKQDTTDILLSNYNQEISLHAKYTFCIECCDPKYSTLEYLVKSSQTKSFIIYQHECDNIKELKKNFGEYGCKR